ncbi:MAG: fumarylacetoacetate hydrolase family protein [Spirochaetaceae bacterium]|jgi:fumarylacetoacetate (FAA) hydrolase|nr:fumarylacetoacetate hydrolase family protein [Spirochaetaceae bacterium]
MKLATIRYKGTVYAGVIRDNDFIALSALDRQLPGTMLELIEGWIGYKPLIEKNIGSAETLCAMEEAEYLPPLPNPRSFRDFMGFEEHFVTVKKKAGRKIVDEYYQMPVFYFSNHQALRASGEPVAAQPDTEQWDFEFEIGFIIGKQGINIPASRAMEYIFGYTILNDWSARDIQVKEQKVGLGPAKGKDYATSIGPVIVTRDELDACLRKDDPSRYDLATKLTLNGRVLRENNIKSILHPFSSMIERASKNVSLFPGELFGSGTLGGGTILEYSNEEVPFLKSGDTILMEVQGIGVLRNIVA